MEKIPVAAVVGPTATGKSRLAAEIAVRLHGEVVSADSMQIYKGMNIGTAKPTEEEMRGAAHHLIGFLEPGQPFSAADYVKLAAKCVSQIHARGNLPVVAGGTGLYVRSLLYNIQFVPESRNENLRAALYEKARREGAGALVEELKSFDPQSAERIHPNNLGRLVRAIEIYRTTGKTMTEQLKISKAQPPPYDACVIGLDYRDRQKLYGAINRRVDKMMDAGLLNEAKQVLSLENAPTALQAIGYKEFIPYFSGECTLEEAVELIKKESRRYAKRQLTWFRRGKNVNWIMIDECSDFSEVCENAFSIISRKGWQA